MNEKNIKLNRDELDAIISSLVHKENYIKKYLELVPENQEAQKEAETLDNIARKFINLKIKIDFHHNDNENIIIRY